MVIFVKIEGLKGKYIHFIGCGGIGMLGLALISNDAGAIISGSDIEESKNTKLLENKSIKLFLGHNKNNLPYLLDSSIKKENCIIVYSSAIRKDNTELVTALQDGVTVFKRGAFLGELAKEFDKVIVVAGSHGKTTVTAIIAYMLNNYGIESSFYIGGMPLDFENNAEYRSRLIFVTEGDESDLSILHLKPSIGIILNLDDDHAWNVGGSESLQEGFLNYAKNSKFVILGSENIPYGFKDALISNKVNIIQKISLDEDLLREYVGIEKENILTALTVAKKLGLDPQKALSAIKSFKGVERRMSNKYESENLTIIEDYAHHPAEIDAVLHLVSQKNKNKKVIIVIQPHREQRVKYFFNAFIKILSAADKVFVLPIFEAWEDASAKLDDKLVLALDGKGSKLTNNWDEASKIVFEYAVKNKPSIILILGAGDNYKLTEKLLTLI